MNSSLRLLLHGIMVGAGMILGVAILTSGYFLGVSSMLVFSILYTLIVLAYPPRVLISPLTVIQAYYFIWFIFAPAFAELHAHENFADRTYYFAYGMLFLTYLTAVFGVVVGERTGLKKSLCPRNPRIVSSRDTRLALILSVLYATSTFLVIMIIVNSGGFAYWFVAPGDAFLNRGGSGVYVVLSHFTTFCLAALVGYSAYISGQKYILLIFFIWLLITSPIHGSKALISLFLVLAMTPWLRNLKVVSLSSLIFVSALALIFFSGLYLRNISWMSLDDAIPYALNYFTTLRNLITIIEDFNPNFLTTFFLPFNKFITPFGLSDSVQYYDMNHMLTDIYFPTAWEIRATEQWPVEADLYLNFYFFFGLPLVFIYTFIVGLIYGRARSGSILGLWIVAMLLTISLISHFRGSLINHLDFYLYPMYLVIYLLFRHISFNDRLQSISKVQNV